MLDKPLIDLSSDSWRRLVHVKLLRQFGAVLLPSRVLCGTGDGVHGSCSGMTVEERACCRAMKSDSGQMKMPASHDFCRKTPGALHGSSLRSNFASFHPVVAVAVWTPPPDLFPPYEIAKGWIPRPEQSPPKPLPSIISVRRV